MRILALGRLKLQSDTIAGLLEASLARFIHVVPVNAEVFVLAHQNEAYERLLRRTSNVIDGRILQQLVRLRNLTWEVSRVTGSDGIYEIAAHCAATGEGLFILGATAEVNAAACARLRELYRGLAVTGYAPPMSSNLGEGEWSDEALARIGACHPTCLGVCLGAPRQEFWIERHRPTLDALGVRLGIGLGGTATFVAGGARRAPVWIQWLGLEWLFRAIVEPGRWRRTLRMFLMPLYAVLPSMR